MKSRSVYKSILFLVLLASCLVSCASRFVVVDHQENKFELYRRFPFNAFDSDVSILVNEVVISANPSRIDSMYINRESFRHKDNAIFYRAHILFEDGTQKEGYVSINNSIKGSNRSLRVEMPFKEVRMYKREE